MAIPTNIKATFNIDPAAFTILGGLANTSTITQNTIMKVLSENPFVKTATTSGNGTNKVTLELSVPDPNSSNYIAECFEFQKLVGSNGSAYFMHVLNAQRHDQTANPEQVAVRNKILETSEQCGAALSSALAGTRPEMGLFEGIGAAIGQTGDENPTATKIIIGGLVVLGLLKGRKALKARKLPPLGEVIATNSTKIGEARVVLTKIETAATSADFNLAILAIEAIKKIKPNSSARTIRTNLGIINDALTNAQALKTEVTTSVPTANTALTEAQSALQPHADALKPGLIRRTARWGVNVLKNGLNIGSGILSWSGNFLKKLGNGIKSLGDPPPPPPPTSGSTGAGSTP